MLPSGTRHSSTLVCSLSEPVGLSAAGQSGSWGASLVRFTFHARPLINDLCVCSAATGVRELQLLREVDLLQLLSDAAPGPRLQPVRSQRLAHQVQSHQLPRLQEAAATLRPLPHEHGHTCVQLPR